MTSTRRPSFTAVTRLRSASFTGSIAGTHASVFAPKQSRAITSCVNRRPTPRRTAQTSVPRVNARARSTWGKGGHPLFSFRLASSFHSPTCKWIRSKEDPRTTPRDRDCPACQEEEKRPEQLTDRELAWQRQFQFLKEFLDKDPYDALFGRSNDMLKGRPWTPRFMWDQRVEPWKLKGWTVEAIAKTTSKADTAKSAGEDLKQKPRQDTAPKSAPMDTAASQKPPNHTKSAVEIPVKKAPLDSPSPKPYIQAHGSWTYSTTDSFGRSSQESGDLVYDAISGRMVPAEKSASSPQPVEAKPPPLPSRPSVESPSASLSTQDVVPDVIVVLPSGPSDHKDMAPKAPRTEAAPSLATGKAALSRPVSIERKLAMVDRLEEDVSIPRTHCTPPPSNSNNASFPFSRPCDRPAHGNVLKGQHGHGPENHAVIGGGHEAERDTKVDQLQWDNKPSPIKHTLEQSWLKETRGSSKAEASTTQDPHYRQAPAGKDPASKNIYRYLARRERAFTHMTAYELGMHRSALLASWARKHTAPSVESAPDRILKKEIAAQKLAMAAFEGKGERGRTSDAPGPSVAVPPRATGPSLFVSNEHNTMVISGEGDMCPDVTKYCNSERMYKKRALHATLREGQRDTDPDLAKLLHKSPEAVRIQNTAPTREEQDKQNLEVYEKKLVSPPYANGIPTAVSEDAEAHDTSPANGTCFRKHLATYEERLGHAPYANGIASIPSAKAEPLVPALDRYASKPETSQPAESTGSLLYRVLTYDAAADSFREESSSCSPVPSTKEERLPFLNALTKLSNPHRFVSHARIQQKQGFEIVAALHDTLVFRRIPDVPAAAAVAGSKVEVKKPQGAAREEKLKPLTPEQPVRSTFRAPGPVINPVDPSLSEPPQTQTGNFASPTGFVNHDIFEPSSPEKLREDFLASRGNQKIRKEEAVFSGSKAITAEEALARYPPIGMNSRERRRRRRGQHSRTRESGQSTGRFWRVALALSATGVAIILFSEGKPSARQKEAGKRETEREKQLNGLEDREHAKKTFTTDILILANSWAAAVRRLWASSTDEAPIKTLPTGEEHHVKYPSGQIYEYVNQGDNSESASKAQTGIQHTLSNVSDAQPSHETTYPPQMEDVAKRCFPEDLRARWQQITAMDGQTADAPSSGSSYTVAWAPHAAYPPNAALTEAGDVAGIPQRSLQSIAIEGVGKDQSTNDEQSGLDFGPVEHTHSTEAKRSAVTSSPFSPESSEPNRHEITKARFEDGEMAKSQLASSNSEKSLAAENTERAEAERLRQRKDRLDAATDVLFDASLLSLTLGGLAWVYLRMLELD